MNYEEIMQADELTREEKRIASKLFRKRILSGLKRHEISKLTGLSECLVAEYENAIRAIPASDLYVFSLALGFELDDIYDQSDFMPSSNVNNNEKMLSHMA